MVFISFHFVSFSFFGAHDPTVNLAFVIIVLIVVYGPDERGHSFRR